MRVGGERHTDKHMMTILMLLVHNEVKISSVRVEDNQRLQDERQLNHRARLGGNKISAHSRKPLRPVVRPLHREINQGGSKARNQRLLLAGDL